MKNYKTDNRADYCEFFEAIKEFSNKKIPRGVSVVLVGDKIRPAKSDEIPFGVVSSFPIMVGNSGGSDAGTSWGGKYIKDEFGNFIWESVDVWVLKRDSQKVVGMKEHKLTGLVSNGNIPEGAEIKKKLVRRVNPEYVETKKYIPRAKRSEWNMVGLLGRVKILKGQPVAPNWIKLKEVSDGVEEWLIR